MGSGLIYGGIVAMWAAYFVPLWLRRHDRLSEGRSIERFASAMSTLRTAAAADRRGSRQMTDDDLPERRPARALARRAVLARRRRLLLGLLVLLAGTAVLTPFTVLPWEAPVVVLALGLGYAARLRSQVRRKQSAARPTLRSRAAASVAATVTAPARSRVARLREARAREAERALAERDPEFAEFTETLARMKADADLAAEQRADAEAAAGWAPVPVTLPTYVTKPKAPGPHVDAGALTAQAREQAEPSVRPDTRAAERAPVREDDVEIDLDLDEILDRRRTG